MIGPVVIALLVATVMLSVIAALYQNLRVEAQSLKEDRLFLTVALRQQKEASEKADQALLETLASTRQLMSGKSDRPHPYFWDPRTRQPHAGWELVEADLGRDSGSEDSLPDGIAPV